MRTQDIDYISKFREKVKEAYCIPMYISWLYGPDNAEEIAKNALILIERTELMMIGEYYV